MDNKNFISGKLYIVSTPIGNKDDFTLRAINTLKLCDYVICEEIKEGARNLKHLNLKKELISLNEQNEIEKTPEIISLLVNGSQMALISDAGTPIFADPGFHLLKAALNKNIEIEVVPGVTSIMTALVRSGFPIDEFLFAGFLSRKNDERLDRLDDLANEKRTVALLEAPYRLQPVLEAANKTMPNRKAYIGLNLTMPFETHHYGTFKDLAEKFREEKVKAEFVICFEGNYGQDVATTRKFRERTPENVEGSDKIERSSNKFESREGGRSDSRSSGSRGGARYESRKDQPRYPRREEKNVEDTDSPDDDFVFIPKEFIDGEIPQSNSGEQNPKIDNFRNADRPDRSDNDESSTNREERPRRSYGGDSRPPRSDDRPRRDGDDRPKRSYGSDSRPPRRDDRPRRDGDDRPKRSYGSDSRPPRRDDDRPRRSFGEDSRPPRIADGDDRPKRPYGSSDDRPKRPYGSSDDRPKRPYGSSDDRPKRPYGSSDDRPKRPYGSSDDRPKRPYGSSDDRPKRPYGSSDDRPKRPYGSSDDRPKRSYGSSDDRPKRSYGSSDDRPKRPEGEERPKRPYGEDKTNRSSGGGGGYAKRNPSSNRGPYKPKGPRR